MKGEEEKRLKEKGDKERARDRGLQKKADLHGDGICFVNMNLTNCSWGAAPMKLQGLQMSDDCTFSFSIPNIFFHVGFLRGFTSIRTAH